VATFKGGLSAWKKAGYALNTSRAMPKYRVPTIEDDEFKQLLGTACYVDVRTPKLYGLGNIKAKFGPNADKLSMDYKKKYFLKIPLYQLSSQYNKIPRGRRIVVFDDKGKQALIASRFLIYSGYKDVCMLKGGISKVKGSE
jgi:rhodanese-related sulfurtransferase